MRYLKKFNESKILDKSVIDECKDILLELEDKGIKTHINSYFSSGIMSVDKNGNKSKNWITFFFIRKEEFQYSDIDDVVERLKSFLSGYGLEFDWLNPIERKTRKPTIKTTRVMDPMTFTPQGVRTECELHFTSK